jgi:hypothetical protein
VNNYVTGDGEGGEGDEVMILDKASVDYRVFWRKS